MSIELESPEHAAKRAQEAGEDDNEAYRFGRPPEGLPYFDPPAPTRVTDPAGVKVEILDFTKKQDRLRFMDVADPIYEGDSNYIAPLRMHTMKFLDPGKNPAYENIEVRPMVAVQGGRDVGRMSVQIDRAYNEYHDTKAAFFGFFECVNDRKVAHAMLNDAVRWLKEKGIEEVFGPANFTLNHQAGLLVENFDRPAFVEETYNPRYYEELFRSFGFGKAKDLLAWWIELADGMETKNRARVARIAERIKKREGITIRHIDMSKLEQEFEIIYELYLAAWQKNWGFAPLTKKEIMWLMADLKDVAVPELVLFVEVKGRTVGFCATLPNVNEKLPKNGRLLPFAWTKLLFGGIKKTKHGRLYTLGMLPEYRKRGLESMMFAETVVRGKAAGFTAGEIGWTLEDNDLINRAIESMDGTLDRRYRILGMKLGSAPGPEGASA
ncbi:MAG: N-acetyltransferase [Myxococcales bacterium]|nr:N-acetyltransferase [Myxococcales bacterium]MCB9650201.1 N-acetyltransferase [Deltaproteobacteria bacterium]